MAPEDLDIHLDTPQEVTEAAVPVTEELLEVMAKALEATEVGLVMVVDPAMEAALVMEVELVTTLAHTPATSQPFQETHQDGIPGQDNVNNR